ncbi:ATP-binding cassette domain-containing protein [Puniceicoccales bacterium CK1056]|uniref:ATP-binding cassette domain-containing protein n=1 Tax=Oceanipulchritudo coccoides TaxID=2706888 RepID=A0A6B2LWK7_9BACT|nr:ATP-binding cassette domain-containing protein [Oceanipulchritudo coccoides]NDV60848.1 ATP-binding cassette domain-containing protein [Oceanipulchritudo coccoides]
MESTVQVEPVSVSVKNLSKSFGTQQVLRDVSFEVKPGEIFVLMGPSGSGKSVLMRHLIGLEKSDSGQTLVGDGDAQQAETHERIRTSMVFQAGALFNSMKVYDNLALYLREHRLYDEATIRTKVESVMKALSIEAAGDKIPAQLSGGMKKRVAVARAIIMEPQLILYDEPTSELDPILAATTTELIATISRETGATSMVVTHDRELALAIGDHVALLMEGELVFGGTPEELRNSTDPAVREFMNPKIDPDNPRFRKQEK